MKPAILTVGVSASGKSTWAHQFIQEKMAQGELWCKIEKDDIRKQICQEKDIVFSWYNWKYKWEKLVYEKQLEMIQLASESEAIHGIILSDTHLNVQRRNNFISKLKALNFSTEIKTFDISFEEACRRDAERCMGVGHSVIAYQYELWLEQQEYARYIPNTQLPKAYIFDIDGTLALKGGRSPYEWDKVELDSINDPVVHLYKLIFSTQADSLIHMIIFSGRDNCCRDKTDRWLTENEIYYTELYMRAEGDNRSDVIVKEEFFWQVAPNYHILGVFDDRPKVANLWRKLQVPLFQVGNPYIDF